jgi:hypothetical protein
MPYYMRHDKKEIVAGEQTAGHPHKARIEESKDQQRAHFKNQPDTVTKKHFIVFKPAPSLVVDYEKEGRKFGLIRERYSHHSKEFRFRPPAERVDEDEVEYENEQRSLLSRRTFDYIELYVFVSGSNKPLAPEMGKSSAAANVARAMAGKHTKSKQG